MDRVALNELNAVVAVTREGSFRGAALALGMSTTALSNGVANLKATVGALLINRTTRSVSLTDAGRAFVEQVALPALRAIQGAMDAVGSKQATPSGTLRINAFASGAREIISPLVLEFFDRPQGACGLGHRGTVGRHRRRWLRPGLAAGGPRAGRHDRGPGRPATALRRRRVPSLFRAAGGASRADGSRKP